MPTLAWACLFLLNTINPKEKNMATQEWVDYCHLRARGHGTHLLAGSTRPNRQGRRFYHANEVAPASLPEWMIEINSSVCA